MRRQHRVSGESARLQMAPLIDVVFLMLSYFLFTLSLGMLEGVIAPGHVSAPLQPGLEQVPGRLAQPAHRQEAVEPGGAPPGHDGMPQAEEAAGRHAAVL